MKTWFALLLVAGTARAQSPIPAASPVAAKPSEDTQKLEDELKKSEQARAAAVDTATPPQTSPLPKAPGAPETSPEPSARPEAAPSSPPAASPSPGATADVPPASPVTATEAEASPPPSAAPEAVASPTIESTASANENVPTEIKALEKSLSINKDPELPQSLFEPNEPGGTLRPSERFSRIPIKPRMSDANWKRWAGPMLEKNYRIRRNDTLWGVSERLFGNPYLWPKVWELNAQIRNPHVIDPGLQLSFTPGNPNSAPSLAFAHQPTAEDEDLPLMVTSHKLSLMEFLDDNLHAQILGEHPPFRYFFLDRDPETIGKIPKPENLMRIYHDVGDGFMAPKLSDGDYAVIRLRPLIEKDLKGSRVQWIGTIRVRQGRAKVTHEFTEISEGDLIARRTFQLSPLALHEDRLGIDERERTQLVPLQEGYNSIASENMLVGLRFAGSDRGPRAGSILTISQGPNKIATILVIDRDRRVGTAWVIESQREIDPETDKID